MNILVTGGLGFIGSALFKMLPQNGYQLYHSKADILDREALKVEVSVKSWDMVFHLAAFSDPSSCVENPEQAKKVNIEGTRNLLEVLENAQGPGFHFVFPSTAHVYFGGDLSSEPVSEDFPLNPVSLYAETKLQAETVVGQFCKNYGMKGTVFRLFNFTHCSQDKKFFLPHVYNSLRQFRGNEVGEVNVGDVDVIRDIGAVQDLVGAFEAVALTERDRSCSRGHQPDVFNICTGRGRNLRELIFQMGETLGFREVRVNRRPGTKPTPNTVLGSGQRFQDRFGWQPNYLGDRDFLRAFLSPIG
ncbi:MAG: NAD(P)-dependent oxidoreductase [Bdellovibrionales bacterium]|nr:NAD(P)-dependent oxidoreductase [Bdellovibrionales bacterium]